MIKEKTKSLSLKFKEHSTTAIIAALSFLIAFVWKDFILKLVDNLLKPSLVQKYPYLTELITAIVITILAIIAISYVSKWSKKEKK